ncbi:shikimate dehydrogenase [Peptostreptococcus faecalis]|uniref:shikimate dehydrogenase n=1 Tax=Peptostreptococcus faecalis TaxID=2045015 RepID=UPI000C7DF8F6|nr:shikimate dehydrogenase [Peptostreptococcus faecalis]
MKIHGLFGEHLSHSISPEIHDFIYKKIGYEANYDIFEFKENDLKKYTDKIYSGEISGVNVTIPYKQKVIPFLDGLDEQSEKIGAVNTINLENNNLIGYNTDYYGIEKLLNSVFPISDKSFLVLGFGGAAKPLIHFLLNNNAKRIYIVSRTPQKYDSYYINYNHVNFVSYKDLYELKADVVINSTPVGMYPNIEACPIEESLFNNFTYAFDLIYNPHETAFIKMAKKHGLKSQNGLKMLVLQAIRAVEIWSKKTINESVSEEIFLHFLGKNSDNQDPIFLVGLPGSGKSTFGKKLANLLGYNFIDLDELIEKNTNISVSEIFKISEEYFRKIESQCLLETSNLKNTVIATGGGVVTQKSNREFLNGFDKVFYISRSCEDIKKENHSNRPLLRGNLSHLDTLFEQREEFYKEVSKHTLYNNTSIDDLISQVTKYL